MKKVIVIIIVILLVIVNLIAIYNKLKTDSILTKVFGYSFLVITSGSMQPKINIGDVILIKEKNNYEVGDIVTTLIDNNYLVTHRIIKIEDETYITKGDNNNCIDDKPVQKHQIQGKVIFKSKILGVIFYYRYLIFLILIIALVLISII